MPAEPGPPAGDGLAQSAGPAQRWRSLAGDPFVRSSSSAMPSFSTRLTAVLLGMDAGAVAAA